MAYNIAANTVIADPVGSYMQGRAVARAENQQALQAQVMQENLAGARQQRSQNAIEFSQQQDIAKSRQDYLLAHAAANSDDPAALIRQVKPEFIQDWDSHHGEGSFDALGAEGQKKVANHLMVQFASKAGIQMPKQMETIGDTTHPEKGILQRDPSTGELKQIVKPEKPEHDAFSPVNLGDGTLGKFNQRTGTVDSTGVKGATRSAAAATGADIGVYSDPDTLDRAATAVMLDPNMMNKFAAMRESAKRDAINQRVTEKMKEADMKPAEVTALQARVKAEVASTKDLIGTQNAIGAFEPLVRANGDRVLELLDKVDSTGKPIFEKYIRAVKRGAKGDEDTSELASVMNQFQTEIARMTTSPNLKGVLSDSARDDIKKIISGDVGAAAGKRIINRLYTEMDIRKAGIDSQIERSGKGISVDKPAATPTAVTPQQTKVLNGKTYVNLTGKPDGWHESQ